VEPEYFPIGGTYRVDPFRDLVAFVNGESVVLGEKHPRFFWSGRSSGTSLPRVLLCEKKAPGSTDELILGGEPKTPAGVLVFFVARIEGAREGGNFTGQSFRKDMPRV